MLSRPASFEETAIQSLVDILLEDSSESQPGFKLHIAHLSSATGVPIIEEARAKGKFILMPSEVTQQIGSSVVRDSVYTQTRQSKAVMTRRYRVQLQLPPELEHLHVLAIDTLWKGPVS